MKTKTKTIKPIDSSVSLIYACPKCSQQHWISLKASQTKGYKIVCDCDEVFRPKRVNKIKILYVTNIIKQSVDEKINDLVVTDNTSQINNIPVGLLDSCVNALSGYGFTKSEASELVKRTYKIHNTNDAISLIKLSLSSNIGVNNEQSVNETN